MPDDDDFTCGTSVSLSYRPNLDECFSVSVEIANDYPDALSSARAEVVRAYKDMIAATLAAYKEVDEQRK